jgi:hypothetical protein
VVRVLAHAPGMLTATRDQLQNPAPKSAPPSTVYIASPASTNTSGIDCSSILYAASS